MPKDDLISRINARNGKFHKYRARLAEKLSPRISSAEMAAIPESALNTPVNQLPVDSRIREAHRSAAAVQPAIDALMHHIGKDIDNARAQDIAAVRKLLRQQDTLAHARLTRIHSKKRNTPRIVKATDKNRSRGDNSRALVKAAFRKIPRSARSTRQAAAIAIQSLNIGIGESRIRKILEEVGLPKPKR
jgi:hypothetical protein